jgi:hypothetical protein
MYVPADRKEEKEEDGLAGMQGMHRIREWAGKEEKPEPEN